MRVPMIDTISPEHTMVRITTDRDAAARWGV
jgi:hypothetical protein